MELYTYQQEGARWLAGVGRGLLADDMGLGKSAQAIAACRQLDVDEIMVVCPASVVTNWQREIERFWPEFRGAVVVSYDRYTRNPKPSDYVKPDRAALILDEAHYLKNRTAKRTKAIYGEECRGENGLVARFEHVFCLTGTPTPNHPDEIWPMLRAVMPKAIEYQPPGGLARRPMNYWQFVSRFCTTRDDGFGVKITGGKDIAKLKERIAPYVLRRKKEDVLPDLPALTIDTLPLEAKISLPERYSAELTLLAKTLTEKGIDGLETIAPHIAQLRRVTGLAKVAPASAWVKDWFEGGGGKLVVFAQHKDVITELWKSFAAADLQPAVIEGKTSADMRQKSVDRFQNDPACKVFLGQLQAASTGITLTASADALFVESSWVPAENEQAAMRIHRIGQANACTVRIATVSGSLDDDIGRAVATKLNTIRQIWD